MHVLEQYHALTPYLLGFSWPLAIARLHGNLACGRGRRIIGPSIQYAAAILFSYLVGALGFLNVMVPYAVYLPLRCSWDCSDGSLSSWGASASFLSWRLPLWPSLPFGQDDRTMCQCVCQRWLRCPKAVVPE